MPQISGSFAGQEASECRYLPIFNTVRPTSQAAPMVLIKHPRNPVIRNARLVAIPMRLDLSAMKALLAGTPDPHNSESCCIAKSELPMLNVNVAAENTFSYSGRPSAVRHST